MISNQQIYKVHKAHFDYPLPTYTVLKKQKADRVRIAYEWLDAQTKTTTQNKISVKHLVESWSGHYISRNDVQLAVYLNPLLRGKYPSFNISNVLIEPSVERIKHIPIAFTQNYNNENWHVNPYSKKEVA